MERGERNGWGRDRGTERAGRVDGRGLTGNGRGREEWTGEGGRKGLRRDGRSRESYGQKEGGMESEGRRGRRERKGETGEGKEGRGEGKGGVFNTAALILKARHSAMTTLLTGLK